MRSSLSKSCLLLLVCSPSMLIQAAGPLLQPLPLFYTCEEAVISWTNGTPPFTLTITSTSDLSSGNVEVFSGISASSQNWLPDLGVCSITVTLFDATYSYALEERGGISAGSSNDCYACNGGYSVDEGASGSPSLNSAILYGQTSTTSTQCSAARSSTNYSAGTSSSQSTSTQSSTISSLPSSSTPPATYVSSTPFHMSSIGSAGLPAPSSPSNPSTMTGISASISSPTGQDSSSIQPSGVTSDAGQSSSPGQTDAGTIAGAAVGAVIGGIFILLAAWIGTGCLRARRHGDPGRWREDLPLVALVARTPRPDDGRL